MDSGTTIMIVLGVIVLLVVLGVASMIMARRRRTQRLQEQFGPEYDHMIEVTRDEEQAERKLEERLEQARALNIRPLSAEEVNHYALEWQATQRDFVDEPLASLQKADRLIRDVMQVKGYPVEDFDERAALISVNYPELVENYRGMHRIAVREASEKISTEEMRQAMIHARALFESLMKQDPNEEHTDQKERI